MSWTGRPTAPKPAPSGAIPPLGPMSTPRAPKVVGGYTPSPRRRPAGYPALVSQYAQQRKAAGTTGY